MLNSNQKPSNTGGIPAPAVPIAVGVLLIGHGILVNLNLVTIPKWIGPVIWIASVIVFYAWLAIGSRKG